MTGPKPSNSVYGFYICKPLIIKFFNEILEFPFGKKTYTVRVPTKVLENQYLYTSFIRGFADNDGGIYFGKRKAGYSKFKQTRHTYPRICLTSVSREIMEQIKGMMDKLDIECTLVWNKPGKKQRVPYYRIFIRGDRRVRKWMELIGFNNPCHLTKVRIWERFGFCPPFTNVMQRKEILEDQRDVREWYVEEKSEPGGI